MQFVLVLLLLSTGRCSGTQRFIFEIKVVERGSIAENKALIINGAGNKSGK